MNHTSTARKFLSLFSSLIFGLLFGLGLIIAGMSNPAKVLAFLDLAGNWDPSLALVMVAAISCALPGFILAAKRQHSLLDLPVFLPTTNKIDRRLLLGSLLFGAGWGLAGICPGPALVLAGSGVAEVFWFLLAMGVGMILFEWFEKWSNRHHRPDSHHQSAPARSGK